MVLPQPISWMGTGGDGNPEVEYLARLDDQHVFMMGDNPALPRMPEKPTLFDFFRLRFNDVAIRHLSCSAKRALDDGLSDNVVMACLLHDIANGCFVRVDHGYWGAQLIAPYVDEEIAWAVKYHQSLRYFADPDVGYEYPESYKKFFGADFVPAEYLRKDAEYARMHPWYMTARYVTLYDTYFFEDDQPAELDALADVVNRNFRQPEEGLGFDNSPSAHMWRTMIWPNNFL
jgi:hypothetical protein